MDKNSINNMTSNQAKVRGQIISGFKYDHSLYGEAFYSAELRVSRLSDCTDTIPLLFSERIVDLSRSYQGRYVEINGQFRSYNQYENHKRHLILNLFVKEIREIDQIEDARPNEIYLDGFICKDPIYRVTPTGREITEILLAVNRSYYKSDYIPCILWGKNARYARRIPVGGHVQLWGRIQSRQYTKKTKKVDKNYTVYEVSAHDIFYCIDHKELSLKGVAESASYGHGTYSKKDCS